MLTKTRLVIAMNILKYRSLSPKQLLSRARKQALTKRPFSAPC